MLLPVPGGRRPARTPIITWVLLATTTIVSGYQIVTTRNGNLAGGGVAFSFGILPAQIRPIAFITYSFVHSDIGHLLINLFYLWVFGGGVESAIGKVRFLTLYLLGGAVGGALQVLVALKIPAILNPNLPIIGASAGCSCLVGLYAVRYYRDRITFVGLPYKPTVVEVVTLFLCLEVGTGLWELFVGLPADGVAHWAHIGGFVFGLSCAYLFHLDHTGQTAYWTEDAATALDRSQPGAAVARLEQILGREPGNAGARSELARAWLAFGDFPQASIQFIEAIRLLISQSRRRDAAYLYREMRDSLPAPGFDATQDGAQDTVRPTWTSTLTPELSAVDLFAVGIALEEIDAVEPAAEALRAVTVRDPNSTEAETALLKVAHIYISRLGRNEEAGILLRLFVDRYPNSALRDRADEMRRGLSSRL